MIDDSMFQERIVSEPVLEEPPPFEELSEKVTFLRLLAYPLSGPGLSVMAIYVLLPFLLWVVVMLLPGVLKMAGGLILLVVNGIVTLSTLWYLTVCIRASAEGQVKAPNVFEFSQDDSFWDWLRGFFMLLVTTSLCIAPAFIIQYFFNIGVAAFWAILGVGVFFLPMLLLALIMFDTINALNPILILMSIFSTLLSYIGIVLLFCVPLTLIIGINIATFKLHNPLLSLLIDAVGLYLLMVETCLLGRFFYNNEEKLRWDV